VSAAAGAPVAELASVLLRPAQRERIETWARAGHPEEVCGFLLGRNDGARLEIVDVRTTANISTDRRERFEIDGLALIAVEQEARRAGLELVGLWHSHPHGPATLSRADLDHAVSTWIQLVACFDARGQLELRAWKTAGRSARELPLRSAEPPVVV
jgi:proteasome lid subunit RPN8/RPN11